MDTRPLAILKTREDHVNWDKYEQQVDLIEQLTSADKRRNRYLRVYAGSRSKLRSPSLLIGYGLFIENEEIV
jgi:hypothetical protein